MEANGQRSDCGCIDANRRLCNAIRDVCGLNSRFAAMPQKEDMISPNVARHNVSAFNIHAELAARSPRGFQMAQCASRKSNPQED
jgi:hypothetical protein